MASIVPELPSVVAVISSNASNPDALAVTEARPAAASPQVSSVCKLREAAHDDALLSRQCGRQPDGSCDFNLCSCEAV